MVPLLIYENNRIAPYLVGRGQSRLSRLLDALTVIDKNGHRKQNVREGECARKRYTVVLYKSYGASISRQRRVIRESGLCLFFYYQRCLDEVTVKDQVLQAPRGRKLNCWYYASLSRRRLGDGATHGERRIGF
jgi:hypothetical protein